MKTFYKEYGCTASVTDNADGTAKLVVRNQNGKKVKDSVYKSRTAAYAAWRRFCN